MEAIFFLSDRNFFGRVDEQKTGYKKYKIYATPSSSLDPTSMAL